MSRLERLAGPVAKATQLVEDGEWSRLEAAEALSVLVRFPLSLAPEVARKWAEGEELEDVLAQAVAQAA